MNGLNLILAQATPTPIPPAELIDKAEEVLATWDRIEPIMGVLFIVALAFFAILFVFWNSRNSTNTALTVLANAVTQKDTEIKELKDLQKTEREMHTESLSAIHDQAIRTNDLSQQANAIMKAQQERGGERDAVLKQLADSTDILIKTGSVPVQQILERVTTIAETAARIDANTADLSTVLGVIQPLLVELGVLRAEVNKRVHDSKPIPKVDPVPTPEANPS